MGKAGSAPQLLWGANSRITEGLKLSCRLVVPNGRLDLSSAVGNHSAKGTLEVPCMTLVACARGPFSEDGAVTGLRLYGCVCVYVVRALQGYWFAFSPCVVMPVLVAGCNHWSGDAGHSVVGDLAN